jgi:peptidyl-tRNA hydrolase, PTH1 family
MENLYLVVGLGNPGEDYTLTRHNAGFRLVELLARRWKASWTLEKKFEARLARAAFEGQRLLLCQPLSYMNVSGRVVQSVAAYFQVDLGRLLVAVDDADLPLGEIRLRGQGGGGGHHGLESIIEHLGASGFARVRLGIGRPAVAGREITGHVLGQFSRLETERFENVLARAASQVECWLSEGLQKAMNQFNGVVDSGDEK